MKSLSILASAAVLCIVAVGCKSTQGKLTYLPNPESKSASDPNKKDLVKDADPFDKDHPIATETPFDPAWSRDPKIFKALTVHFDYDSSAVKSEETSKLQQIAEYLKANPSKALSIEGACGEQATEEYTRSLGDRRALALRDALAKLDVAPGRLDTISFGKDKPVDNS